MGRAPCCDKASVKKGPWSQEEDKQLKEYIEKHGTGGNWIALPHKAGLKRCGKSCRLRWLNYLRPNIKHGDFSDDEDRVICSLYASIGSRWSIIASQLPGRTDNDIKNYWNTKLKKKLLGIPPPQRKSYQQRQQQQHFPSSSFETTTPPFSYSPGLGVPISPYLFNSLPSPASSSSPLLQGPAALHQSSRLIMFGGEQSCSSSDGSSSNRTSYVNDTDQLGLYHRVVVEQQLGFENNHLYSGLEETQKMILLSGTGEASTDQLNFQGVKPLVVSTDNNGCNTISLDDHYPNNTATTREVSLTCLKAPWRPSMYFY